MFNLDAVQGTINVLGRYNESKSLSIYMEKNGSLSLRPKNTGLIQSLSEDHCRVAESIKMNLKVSQLRQAGYNPLKLTREQERALQSASNAIENLRSVYKAQARSGAHHLESAIKEIQELLRQASIKENIPDETTKNRNFHVFKDHLQVQLQQLGFNQDTAKLKVEKGGSVTFFL